MENLPAKPEDNVLHIWNESTQSTDVIDLNTGLINPTHSKLQKYNGTQYSHSIGDLICDHIRAGITISKLAKDPHMPSTSTIYAWMSTNVEFKRRVNDARKQRAEHFHDMALDIALSVTNKDEVPVARLQIDTLKWAAEKNDPERFNKPKEVAAVSGGMTIVLDLGMGHTVVPMNYDIDDNGELKEILNESAQMGGSNGVRSHEHRGDIELATDRWKVFSEPSRGTEEGSPEAEEEINNRKEG